MCRVGNGDTTEMQRRGWYFGFGWRWVLVMVYRKPFRVQIKSWPMKHKIWGLTEVTPWENVDG